MVFRPSVESSELIMNVGRVEAGDSSTQLRRSLHRSPLRSLLGTKTCKLHVETCKRILVHYQVNNEL